MDLHTTLWRNSWKGARGRLRYTYWTIVKYVGLNSSKKFKRFNTKRWRAIYITVYYLTYQHIYLTNKYLYTTTHSLGCLFCQQSVTNGVNYIQLQPWSVSQIHQDLQHSNYFFLHLHLLFSTTVTPTLHQYKNNMNPYTDLHNYDTDVCCSSQTAVEINITEKHSHRIITK